MNASFATAGRLIASGPPEQAGSLRDNPQVIRLLIMGGVAFSVLMLLLSIGLGLFGLLDQPVMIAAVIFGVLTLLPFLVAYVFLRAGRIALSSRVIAYGLVLCITIGAALIGGATGPISYFFFLCIVGSGLLSGGRSSISVAATVIVAFLTLLGLESAGLVQPLPASTLFVVIDFLATTAFLAYMVWLVSRDLSLVVAQSHERAEELMRKTEQLMEKNIQQIELGSELAAAASQLQIASQQQASGSTEQASAVTQVSTTIEELGSTARQIAQSADHVSQAAQQTLENLSSGQDAVDESIQAMERIRGRVSDVSNRVLSLGERSQQIGEIIDLIDDISDETHLLALNAAIEAAGAGEHGRRFAVVAAEVKSLANRTLAAAREVKGVIAEIRQATAASVLAAEEGSKEVERGVELAHRAGQTMDNIVMVAERTAQSAAEIGLATAQQQSASEQVVETMREIAEVARQTALGSRQMADSAATLTAIADRLHGIVANDE
ncbi:MAG: methyl-accepting chemotaxis protein [Oscillochloridaceae bacterium umkhey_bin13]